MLHQRVLMSDVLGRTWEAEDRSVERLVFGLRRKLPKVEGLPAIGNVRGRGFFLRMAVDMEAK